MPTPEAPPVDAVLVGYENQENLGLRSILAYLRHKGFRAALIPFHPSRQGDVVREVLAKRPRLVGFSLIFQYALDEFGALMKALRDAGVTAHFTAGGHFPSLAPEETLELLPALDTVVRFEGELTLVELMEHLDEAEAWGAIQGLAFRREGSVVLTPPRPLIEDLDSLPPVARDEPKEVGGGLLMASMLASRGCLYNCSFCSIRQFYGTPPGPLRRARSPQAVVDEMAALYTDAGVRVFLFQDDDFAARTPQQRAWVQAYMDALVAAGLVGNGRPKVGWKISCRVDDLAPDILEAMLDHGLVGVYLGVESGSEQGLKVLNKLVTVDQNRRAIELLKAYDVAMSMGFMLFDPGSTVETLRENIRFLREVGADGHFPINFCKMLPYAGTPIQAELRKAGRLRGSTVRPDYGFLDPRVDWYAFLVHRIFGRRNFDSEGLLFRLQQADADVRFQRALTDQPIPEGYEPALRALIRRANVSAVETLSDLLDALVEQGAEPLVEEEETLLALADREWRAEAAIETELAHLMLQDQNAPRVSDT
ncbi:MAG: B12-binding domain-containing radical SAM protein [Anaerolineae bacterium]